MGRREEQLRLRIKKLKKEHGTSAETIFANSNYNEAIDDVLKLMEE